MIDREVITPDAQFIRTVKKAGGDTLKKCYQCATCSVVCKLSPNKHPFPRKEMLWAQWGLKDRLVKDPDVWACYQCNDCSKHCPRGARPGDVLAGIRTYTYSNYSFPRFMGKALASPKALPILFLVPIVLLFALMYLSAPLSPAGGFLFLQAGTPIDFNLFLPHHITDAFFVVGNIIIFLFAFVGFWRFWKDLTSTSLNDDFSFRKGLVLTAKEILSHSKFNKCEMNKPRAVAHYLVIAGFVSAFISTGMVFVLIFIPDYIHLSPLWNLPLELPNPVKIFGALGGIGILVGTLWMIIRRWKNRDDVGANGYADYLFLYIIFFTGLTGLLSWLFRWLSGVPLLAYITYFSHLTFVFFLLWYMPYSKFAHMIYRTMALVYLRGKGIE